KTNVLVSLLESPNGVRFENVCQTYARIPKHLIRDNANLLILFKQDGTNLKHVYNDHVNTDMSYDEGRCGQYNSRRCTIRRYTRSFRVDFH
ncbi:hypothetical protein ALC57_02564, partial [Trachymyrmex cornetzi]